MVENPRRVLLEEPHRRLLSTLDRWINMDMDEDETLLEEEEEIEINLLLVVVVVVVVPL